MSSSSESVARPSQRYGRYEVLFKIASGGMAEVFAARIVGEGGFEKLVALKRMLPTLAEDEKFVAMFLDEGRVAANISSPYVVQTLDLGRAEDDSLYLVMELVRGVSLSALARALSRESANIPVSIAAEILAQAAQGLDDAHEARTVLGDPLGIIHRDISPQNVLVDVQGRARITDFGVARALERITTTQSGEVKGKLAYFAPEQARGEDIDRRADVFAFGVVAWEVLAGQRLFAGSNPADTLTKLLTMPVPPLDSVRPDVPAALARAVEGALERDRGRRTAAASDLAHAIRRSVECAPQSTVAAFVRAHAGDALVRMETGLRSQTPSSPGMRTPRGDGQEASGVIAAAPRDASSRGGAVGFDEAPTTMTPSSVLRSTSAIAPALGTAASLPIANQVPRSRRGPVIATVGLVAIVAAASAAWIANRPTGAMTVTEIDDAPAGAATAPTSVAPALEGEAAPEEVPGPEVELAPIAATAETEPAPPTAETEIEAEGAPTARPTARERARARRGAQRGVARTTADATEPEPTPRVAPPEPTPRAAAPERTPRTAAPEPTRAATARPAESTPREEAPAARRRPLLGLDDFDRDLQ